MIGNGLTSLVDGLPMCHVTCWHNHVTVKGKLSRCHPKSGVVGTVHCPLYRCKELMLDVGIQGLRWSVGWQYLQTLP